MRSITALPSAPAQFEAWEAEYKANVRTELCWARLRRERPFLDEELWAGQAFPDEWLEDLEMMEPGERQLVLDELAARQARTNKESEAKA